MNQQARFIIRPDKKLIIGHNFKKSKLKSNVIYEIQDIMGEFILKKIGKSSFKLQNWGYDISTIITDFNESYLMTSKEFNLKYKV